MGVTGDRLLDETFYGFPRFFESEYRVVVGVRKKKLLRGTVPRFEQFFGAGIPNRIIPPAINAKQFVGFDRGVSERFESVADQKRHRQKPIRILRHVLHGIVRRDKNDFSYGLLAREVGRDARSETPTHDDDGTGIDFFDGHEILVNFDRVGKKPRVVQREFSGRFPISPVVETDDIGARIRRIFDKIGGLLRISSEIQHGKSVFRGNLSPPIERSSVGSPDVPIFQIFILSHGSVMERFRGLREKEEFFLVVIHPKTNGSVEDYGGEYQEKEDFLHYGAVYASIIVSFDSKRILCNSFRNSKK